MEIALETYAALLRMAVQPECKYGYEDRHRKCRKCFRNSYVWTPRDCPVNHPSHDGDNGDDKGQNTQPRYLLHCSVMHA